MSKIGPSTWPTLASPEWRQNKQARPTTPYIDFIISNHIDLTWIVGGGDGDGGGGDGDGGGGDGDGGGGDGDGGDGGDSGGCGGGLGEQLSKGLGHKSWRHSTEVQLSGRAQALLSST